MMELLTAPWPWYVSGPLIGLMVPFLLLAGNKSFGVSSTMKDICAYCLPSRVDFFKYDVKKNWWNLAFVLGIILGALLVNQFFQNPEPIAISAQTKLELNAIGIHTFDGLMPVEFFNWRNVLSSKGVMLIFIGGFLVGFGVRYAGGCTSGHAIMGLSQFSRGSFIAVIGFFVGGLTMTHLIFPFIFK